MADPSQMNMVRISQKAGGSVFCEPVFHYPALPGEETSRQKMLEVLADEIGDGVWRLALVVAEPATFQTPPFLSGSGPSLPSWNYGQSSSGRRCL